MQNQSNPKIIKLILWGALFMTNFLYLGMMTMFPSSASGILPNGILLIAGIMLVVLSFFITRFVKPDSSVANSENVPFILSLAINEAASVIAFIMGFIGQDMQKAYILFAISILGFVFKFPKDAIAASSIGEAQTKSKLDL